LDTYSITLNSDGKQLAVGSLDIFHCAAMSRTATAKTCKVDHSNDCFDVGANMILSRLSFVGALDNIMGLLTFFQWSCNSHWNDDSALRKPGRLDTFSLVFSAA
jgi:hypothetical protein